MEKIILLLQNTVSEFESRGLGIAVKPQGLTGGKGVKVMPEHLSTYQDCVDYASSLLLKKKNHNEKVLLVEKLEGIEFTIMGITDGENLGLSCKLRLPVQIRRRYRCRNWRYGLLYKFREETAVYERQGLG